ncbi:MAG: ABC transporter permease, partial [Fimbriiglobus sp.]|nr:ABC transporter permease [Fimbriiglobus sp.]
RRISLIFALAVKDWSLFLADKRAAVLGFLVPIVLASTFGLIFARPADKPGGIKLPLLVSVEGDGPLTHAIAAEFAAGPRVEAEVVPRDDIEKRLADRRPGVAVVFPAEFEQLAAWKPGTVGSKPKVHILHNPLCASEAQWAEGLVSEAVMRRVAKDRLGPVVGESALTLPFDVQTTEQAEHAGFNSYSHSFNGMTLQYLLFWGMESGLLLLRDRQRSVWNRLRAAPVPLWCVLLSKAISTAAIAFLMVLTTFAFGHFVFGVTVTGSVFGFLLLALTASLLAAATGLLVAAVGGTEARARSVCILIILGVSMLGGLWLPAFVLPGWARDLSLSLPTTWAMRGLDGVTWQGRDFFGSLPSVSVVAGFTAVFLAVAVAKLVSSEARRRRGMA